MKRATLIAQTRTLGKQLGHRCLVGTASSFVTAVGNMWKTMERTENTLVLWRT